MGPSLDRVVLEWEGTPSAARRRARFGLAEVLLEVDADDPGLLDELASVLGRPRDDGPDGEVHARFEARVRARGGPAGFGHLKLGPADGGARLS